MIVNNTNKTIRLKKNCIVASANKIERVNLVSNNMHRWDEKVDKFDMTFPLIKGSSIRFKPNRPMTTSINGHFNRISTTQVFFQTLQKYLYFS
jgi:hypothetical protein